VSAPLVGVDRIRVLTYNLRDLKDDAAAVARVVRAVAPDVACLQEVPRHVFAGHRVGGLADACRLLWSGGGVRSGGTAVLTSLRVDQRSSLAARLPVKGLFARTRGFASAVVAVPGGPTLTVASVHLGLGADERQRLAALVLGQLQASGPAPYVVAGDFNEPPGGPAWRVFGAVVRDASAALAGAGGAAGPGGASGSGGAGLTFPARAPRQRIDAVLVSAGLLVHSVRVVGVADGVDPADLLAASDHLPVVVDLQIPPV
jgi:endonuclease/exonuclease/phosphatase family metal-dependent hydrolase